jgi:predicted alpha/beta-hydrolase family hydrolase
VAEIRFRADDEGRETSASLEGPRGRARATLVLGHGAGGDRRQESLVLLQGELARRSVRTLVFNFPYAEARRRRPDRAPVLERAFRNALERARGLVSRGEPLFAGGRSLGGRIATHLAAAGEPLAGLVLLGYPLHPAGEPSKLRVEHWPRIPCPVLFVSGTKDRLAPRELLSRHVATLGDRAKLHWIEGADHGLDLGRRSGRDRADVARECADEIVAWIGGLSPPRR